MEDSSDLVPKVTRDPGAQFIYFDIIPTYGIMNGAIQVDLGSRVLLPVGEGTVAEFIVNGHLRCSPAAAVLLRDAINQCLLMLDQPSGPQQAAPKSLN